MSPADKCNSNPTSVCSDNVKYVTSGGSEIIKYLCKTYLQCVAKITIALKVRKDNGIRIGKQSTEGLIWLKILIDTRRAAIGWAATISLRLRITNKTSYENLKPRKGEPQVVKILQCNMQKSQHVQIDLNRRISGLNRDQERFICCIQEPCSTKSKLIRQPNTVQRFGTTVCPRTCIYVDTKTDAWFMDSLSTKDITAIQVCILQQQVLVLRRYRQHSMEY